MVHFRSGSVVLAVLLTSSLFAADPPHDPVQVEQGAHWCATGTAVADEARSQRFDAWTRSRQPRSRMASEAETTSGVRTVDGIYIVEADAVNTPFDNAADISNLSIDFTPTSATSYTVRKRPLAFESGTGQPRNAFISFGSELVTLTKFEFPFGTKKYKNLWVGANKAIYFSEPLTDTINQFSALEAPAIAGPVIAPLMITTKSYGSGGRSFVVYASETADAVTITWKSRTPSTWDEQVQAVLSKDGSIRFSYGVLPEDSWGTVAIVSGEEGLYSSRQVLAQAADPADDTSADAKLKLSAEINGMLDIVNFSAERLSNSDLYEYRIKTRLPLVRNSIPSDGFFDYYIRPGVKNLGNASRMTIRVYRDRHYLNTASAPWMENTTAVRFDGDTLIVRMLESLHVADSAASSVDTYTFHNSGSTFTNVEPSLVMDMAREAATTSFLSDISKLEAETSLADRPLVEAFTLPVLNVQGVWSKVKSATQLTDAEADEVAIYQNFLTDLILYAGGYSTVGNPGADGVRAVTSTYGAKAEKRPALLHLDKIGRGWNASESGRLHLMTHEFGHRWLYAFQIKEGTSNTNSLRASATDAHPKKGVHIPAAFSRITETDASAMGGGYFTNVGPNRYKSSDASANYGYSWHELYLMGLAAAEEVTEPWYYLKGEGLEAAYYPDKGRTYDVTSKTDVTMQQIIDAMGLRFPSIVDSQKEFKIAYVLLERPSRRVTAEQVAEFKAKYVQPFFEHFAAVTNNRGKITIAAPANPTPVDQAPSTGRPAGLRRR